MFELDGDIRRWREGLMRRSSLSPWELDALEDYLRATLLLLRYTHPSRGRWLTWLMTGATTLNLYWAIVFALGGLNPLVELGIGYWAWLGSFGCLAAALWLRDREWASAKAERVIA